MGKNLTKPDPIEFGFTSFAQMIGKRDPIVGETDLPFLIFRNELATSLKSKTAYEAVIAENLIAIEWDLLQHRRMRDATLRSMTELAVRDAVANREEIKWNWRVSEERTAWIAAKEDEGNVEYDEDDFEHEEFDEDAAQELGADLVRRVLDPDVNIQSRAEEELIELGLSAVEIMSEAYCSYDRGVTHHDEKIQELERRRRQVKADFDALQKARPVEVEVIEG